MRGRTCTESLVAQSLARAGEVLQFGGFVTRGVLDSAIAWRATRVVRLQIRPGRQLPLRRVNAAPAFWAPRRFTGEGADLGGDSVTSFRAPAASRERTWALSTSQPCGSTLLMPRRVAR